MENGSPLEGSSVLLLASRAVAQLAVERLGTAELKADGAAMTTAFELHGKVLIRLVDSIRWTLLPIVFAFGAGADLVLSWMQFGRISGGALHVASSRLLGGGRGQWRGRTAGRRHDGERATRQGAARIGGNEGGATKHATASDTGRLQEPQDVTGGGHGAQEISESRQTHGSAPSAFEGENRQRNRGLLTTRVLVTRTGVGHDWKAW